MEAGEVAFCNVIREGRISSVNSEEMVVGDLVQIEAGQKIAADMILINAEDIQCDES